MGYLHKSDGMIDLHDYGDICQVHNVICDDPEYQVEDCLGSPAYVRIGYVCPICRAEVEQLMIVEPPLEDNECPF